MRTLITTFLAVLSLAFAWQVTEVVGKEDTVDYRDLYRTTTVYGVIQENFSEYKEIVPIQANGQKPQEGMDKHHDKSSDDYLGAIEIPSIGTSDAIYRSNGDYYLSHNFKKEAYEPGEIYLDDRTGESILETGALLNGHAVPNGTKFGSFKKLLEVKEQPEVLIWDEATKTEVKYKMLFISLIDGQNSGIIMKFDNEAHRLRYYKNLYSTSIKQWEAPSKGDTYLLLNSCAYIIQDGHYVVVAKKEE
ncbi:sortase family protein [Lysinibacillus xylanilyticus]|uniref:hypothetical protein n=1 Tax=Lysinibacillus xylanilyticus TaxID=582475 RepID=UPI0036DB200D